MTMAGPVLPIAEASCPVFVAAASVRAMRPEDPTIRFVSGWGGSWAEAVQRCRMEAAERCSAQFFGDEALRRARWKQIGAGAVPPSDLLLVSQAQIAIRGAWNKAHPGLTAIPPAWRPDRRIDWIACDERLSERPGWLPAGYCLLGHRRDRASGLAPANSSGVAAGQTLDSAALSAFLELVERDAVAIWWYNRIRRPRLSVSAAADPLVEGYADWALSRARILELHDLTHDLRIPVVAAVARQRDGARITFGFGAGGSAAEAARHAVGELAQCEANLSLIEDYVARHGLRGLTADARALLSWARSARIRDHPHLLGGPVRSRPRPALELDLAECRRLCRRNGLVLLALDLTRPGIGVPVARIVVPGLRPLWARFAPGRLYDVPVRLGWRRRRAAESALNPIPLMI
jgi:thiazole/oxazole-forming peptide maturase SagD family component